MAFCVAASTFWMDDQMALHPCSPFSTRRHLLCCWEGYQKCFVNAIHGVEILPNRSASILSFVEKKKIPDAFGSDFEGHWAALTWPRAPQEGGTKGDEMGLHVACLHVVADHQTEEKEDGDRSHTASVVLQPHHDNQELVRSDMGYRRSVAHAVVGAGKA